MKGTLSEYQGRIGQKLGGAGPGAAFVGRPDRLEEWGDRLEQTVTIGPGDMVYVPPRETHLLTNLSDSEAAEYVVARDSPTEDSVEVPWAG